MVKKIGYIGLGLMGKPIATNLLNAGFQLSVFNRSSAPVEELVSMGATSARSPRAVAEVSEVVFTNLPDSPDVEQVVLGREGIIEGASPGTIYVDNSTIKPETARMIAEALGEKGISALDAPVSGGDVGAKAGTLAIMVGGPAEALEKVLPVFEAMGETITHVGESGAGQVAKACNQVMTAAQMVAMGELIMLAQRAGVSAEKVVEAIRGGAAQCWTLDVKPPRLFAGDRAPGFRAQMMHKDLGIVLDTARAYGVPMPTTASNMQLYESMLQLGMGELDNSGVIGVLETLIGEQLAVSSTQ